MDFFDHVSTRLVQTSTVILAACEAPPGFGQRTHEVNDVSVCRACGHFEGADKRLRRCPACDSPRLASHSELDNLNIAHIDCDAFYASVEKRDNPELKDRPVIVGGGKRGVVSACCYIARLKGVHSAMPMFQANKLCPTQQSLDQDAKISSHRATIHVMLKKTPLVEPRQLMRRF